MHNKFKAESGIKGGYTMKILDKLQEAHSLIKKYENLQYKDYHICFHYHWNNLTVSAWHKQDKANIVDPINFILENGKLKIGSTGSYSNKIAQEILCHIRDLGTEENMYTVEVKETLSRLIKTHATSESEAIKNITYQYNHGLVLDDTDIVDTEITIFKD